MSPVLVMTLTYSKVLSAVMIPPRQAGEILACMWQLIASVGKLPGLVIVYRHRYCPLRYQKYDSIHPD